VHTLGTIELRVRQGRPCRKIGIPYGSNPETCPVRVRQAWIEAAGISSGPRFRSIGRHGHVQPGRLSPIDVARVVKKLAQRAGLDSAKYAGHSLRAGHATSAAIAGASEWSIMNRPATGACRWFGGTFGMAVYSARIAAGSSGCSFPWCLLTRNVPSTSSTSSEALLSHAPRKNGLREHFSIRAAQVSDQAFHHDQRWQLRRKARGSVTSAN
jgi:hypothetical protein